MASGLMSLEPIERELDIELLHVTVSVHLGGQGLALLRC